MNWPRRTVRTLQLAAFALGGALVVLFRGTHVLQARTAVPWAFASTQPADTLVLYVFSNTNAEYMENLQYFLREAIKPNDSCHYIIVINYQSSGDKQQLEAQLPSLPPAAMYMYHENQCFDWGTFGWVLKQQGDALHRYKYFLFMNSSVRGPYVPVYLQGSAHWTEHFKAMLTNDVKLVGPTISCEGTAIQENFTAVGWSQNPHVQSYAVMTDRRGLQILRDDGDVFACYSDFQDTIYRSELGASRAILEAGYNIASFMPMYAGVDWRKTDTWACNEGRNPYETKSTMERALWPVGQMFVKMKESQDALALDSLRWVHRAARKMHLWKHLADLNTPDVHSNEFVEHPYAYRMGRVLEAVTHGENCFDSEHYMHHNPDLQLDVDDLGLKHPWVHYINFGQFEERPARFSCRVPADAVKPFSFGETGNLLWRHTDKYIITPP